MMKKQFTSLARYAVLIPVMTRNIVSESWNLKREKYNL